MSLEAAIEKLAAAILTHADALKLAATHSVTIDCSVDTKAAVEAVKEVAEKAEKKAEKKTEKKTEKVEDKGPIYWADNTTGFFGKVDSEAEYAKKKAESETVYKITEDIHAKKLAELKAKNEAKAKAEKEAAEAAKAAEVDDDPTAQATEVDDDPTAEAPAAAELHVPSEDEYKAIWGRFLKIDDKEVRDTRLKWTRELLEHFGAPKATEINKAEWAVVYNLVETALAEDELPDLSAL